MLILNKGLQLEANLNTIYRVCSLPKEGWRFFCHCPEITDMATKTLLSDKLNDNYIFKRYGILTV